MGGFNRAEVLALDVFYQGDLQELRLGDFLNHHRNVRKTGQVRRTPSALPGHNLKARTCFADNQRLDDAIRPNGVRQFLELVGTEKRCAAASGSVRMGSIGRRLVRSARGRGCVAAVAFTGRRAESPLPSALRCLSVPVFILKDLLGELDIAFRAARPGVIHQNGLSVAGRFRQADASRDHRRKRPDRRRTP